MYPNLRMTVYAAMLSALIAVGSFVAIPVGPVPIVLQNMFVLLSGLLLGKNWGLCSVAVYLIAGTVGLPVFAQGKGGMGVLFGPTGGYLLSYPFAVYITGLVSWKAPTKSGDGGWERIFYDGFASVLGTVAIYAGGVSWLTIWSDLTWFQGMAWGLFPFLPGDALKIAAAVAIARTVRPIIHQKSIAG